MNRIVVGSDSDFMAFDDGQTLPHNILSWCDKCARILTLHRWKLIRVMMVDLNSMRWIEWLVRYVSPFPSSSVQVFDTIIKTLCNNGVVECASTLSMI